MTSLVTQPPLRLMIYDSSDTKSNIKKLRRGISDKSNEVINAILPDDIEEADFDIPLGMTHSWIVGGKLYRALGRIDASRGFSTWKEALAWIADFEPDHQIAEIQFWGHGSPGRVWMLEDGALDRDSFTGEHMMALGAIRRRLVPDAHVWFRCCGVFTGVRGYDFAMKWSNGLGCRISAHTHIIGFWQAGTHTAIPGVEPHWSLKEGLDDKSRVIISSRTSPNRLWFMSNEVPRGW